MIKMIYANNLKTIYRNYYIYLDLLDMIEEDDYDYSEYISLLNKAENIIICDIYNILDNYEVESSIIDDLLDIIYEIKLK